jgi:hypothetical protein
MAKGKRLEFFRCATAYCSRRVDMDRLYQNGGSPLGPALISYDAIYCDPTVEWVAVDQR